MSNIVDFFIAYLIGMIPFGEIYAYLLGFEKLKTQGSGNIGATNAYRVGGKLLGILTLVSDILKGVIPILIFQNEWVALAVVMGHIRVPFFTGGKGVATALGVFLVLSSWMTLIMALLWGGVFILRKTSSLSSIITFTCLPIFSYFFHINILMSIIMSGIILFAHRFNIIRIYLGQEASLLKK